MAITEPPAADPVVAEDCAKCRSRAVHWSPLNRMVQCHACGAIADTVTLTRTELLMLMGQVALPPYKDHPEAAHWDCAPLAEGIIEAVEKVIHDRDDKWVSRRALTESVVAAVAEDAGPTQHEMIVALLDALGVHSGAKPFSSKVVWEEALANVRAMAEASAFILARRQVLTESRDLRQAIEDAAGPAGEGA